jgi:hypothetical protein
MLVLMGGEAVHACKPELPPKPVPAHKCKKEPHVPEQEPVSAQLMGINMVFAANTSSGMQYIPNLFVNTQGMMPR